jgi:ADP-ribosylglycohydrolase
MGMMASDIQVALDGCLMGGAVGDAVGLCCEGLTRHRQERLFPVLDGPMLIGRYGMVSDDTDHARMTGEALIEAGNDADLFARALARRFRAWLLSAPAGVGFATLRAGMKLLFGCSPSTSGVFSAGNGPAMRAPILGVAFGDDFARMREFVRASTWLTHTDPKAEWGALSVALAASMAAHRSEIISPSAYMGALVSLLPPDAGELLTLVGAAARSAEACEPSRLFADRLGLGHGIGGYIYDTVPVVLQTWLRRQSDYRPAVLEIVRCGGDTDTTAAILGGIIGARVGRRGVPADWIGRIYDPAFPLKRFEALAQTMAEVRRTGVPGRTPRLPLGRVAARNALFAAVVISHGFRRLLPPY